MAPLRAFWVILAGATPTAFRAGKREDLLTTLHQLQRTQPDVSLRWFDRGRVWSSPDEARAALTARRRSPRPHTREWRPGGLHKDPRARFKVPRDEKRARFKKRAQMGPRPPRPGGAPGRPGGPPGRPDRPPGRTGRPPGRTGKPPGSKDRE